MSKTNQLRDLRSNHLAVAFSAAAMFTQNFDNMMMPPKSHILGTPNREG